MGAIWVSNLLLYYEILKILIIDNKTQNEKEENKKK